MNLATLARITPGYRDTNIFIRVRTRPLRNYPFYSAHTKGMERYTSYEHTMNASRLIREYRLDSLKNEYSAARKLNLKLQALGKDKNNYEVVFLTF